MAKKQYQIDANDEVALKEDFTLGTLAAYVVSLFSSDNTSLISTINGVVAAPNATLAAALGSDS